MGSVSAHDHILFTIGAIETGLKKTFLLVLPQWELNDIGLLVYNYLIRKKGHKTIFLGQGLPLQDVERIHELVKLDVLITPFSTPASEDDMVDYLKTLSSHFKGIPVYVGGIQMENICDKIPENIKKFSTAIDFRDKVLSIL